jgi:hypothetical protein
MEELIAARRRELGAPALTVDPSLVALAEEAAVDALDTDQVEEMPARVAARASELTHRRVGASVHVLYDLDALDGGDLAEDPDFRRLGLALRQDSEDLHGRTVLVLLLSE